MGIIKMDHSFSSLLVQGNPNLIHTHVCLCIGDKRTWTYIFGACCVTTVSIPSFHNYQIWSFLGLVMTTYTAWYPTAAPLLHGQVEGVKHSGRVRPRWCFHRVIQSFPTFSFHPYKGFACRPALLRVGEGHRYAQLQESV